MAPPPPKGYGGLEIPALHHAKQHSQSEDTPPSDKVRDTIRREQVLRVAFRGEMEHLAQEAKNDRRDAKTLVGSIESKLNLILYAFAGVVTMAIGAFVWLFSLQQTADKRATETAGREARIVVLEQDRHFEERAEAIAKRAVQLDREERAKDMLVITAKHQ
jgi:hypothetical protein